MILIGVKHDHTTYHLFYCICNILVYELCLRLIAQLFSTIPETIYSRLLHVKCVKATLDCGEIYIQAYGFTLYDDWCRFEARDSHVILLPPT